MVPLDVAPGTFILAKGLDFLMKIFPWQHETVHHASPLTSGKDIKRKRKKVSRKKQRNGQTTSSATAASAARDSSQPTQIGSTALTQVFKERRRIRNAIEIVAAKVCRKPDLKWATETWENEARILGEVGDCVCRSIRSRIRSKLIKTAFNCKAIGCRHSSPSPLLRVR